MIKSDAKWLKGIKPIVVLYKRYKIHIFMCGIPYCGLIPLYMYFRKYPFLIFFNYITKLFVYINFLINTKHT